MVEKNILKVGFGGASSVLREGKTSPPGDFGVLRDPLPQARGACFPLTLQKWSRALESVDFVG